MMNQPCNYHLSPEAKGAGVDVTLDLVPHMPHAFQWCSAFLPESRDSDDRITGWARKKLNPESG